MAAAEFARGDCLRLPAPRGRRGHEQRGSRYAVVLQADELRGLSTLIVAPTSTSARAATFRPAVRIEGEPTRVLVEQMGVVDPMRLGPIVDRLDGAEMALVDEAVRLMLAV